VAMVVAVVQHRWDDSVRSSSVMMKLQIFGSVSFDCQAVNNVCIFTLLGANSM